MVFWWVSYIQQPSLQHDHYKKHNLSQAIVLNKDLIFLELLGTEGQHGIFLSSQGPNLWMTAEVVIVSFVWSGGLMSFVTCGTRVHRAGWQTDKEGVWQCISDTASVNVSPADTVIQPQ